MHMLKPRTEFLWLAVKPEPHSEAFEATRLDNDVQATGGPDQEALAACRPALSSGATSVKPFAMLPPREPVMPLPRPVTPDL